MKLRYLLTCIFITIATTTSAQITWDSTRNLSRHEGGYGKFTASIKTSIFYNGSLGVEVVRVRNNLSGKILWFDEVDGVEKVLPPFELFSTF